MGQINFSAGETVYLDTAPIIYSVEKHADYLFLLQPLWIASENGDIQIVTSELTLLETLVAPLKQADTQLVAEYENLLTNTEILSVAVSKRVLRRAADLRAQHNLKTPDAIHAATALLMKCTLFVANDSVFKRISGWRTDILKDLI